MIAAEIIGLVLDAGGQITADGPDLVLPYGRRSRTTPRLLAALPDKAGPVDSLPLASALGTAMYGRTLTRILEFL